MHRRATLRWLLLFLPLTTLFYWKILLTRQFSLLTERESVNQAYSWMQFVITSVRQGILPMWDPYTLAGHSFLGEMQTAAFYPVHLLLALVPFDSASVLSPIAYHVWFAVTHVLAACFMFALIRELGLSRFSAFIGGICFSFGGFVARITWPHLLESAIWMPLVFLFLLRALRASSTRLAALDATIAAAFLGLSVLAGGLHVILMEALVIVSAGIFHACTSKARMFSVFRATLVVAIIGIVGSAAGAIQLLPSIEYSSRVLRFIGPSGALPANQKIPYADMNDEFLPQSIGLLISPFAFNGTAALGEATNPYIGVFPLLAVIIGIRRYWRDRWVRYLTGLAVAAFLFTLGNYSWLHGLLYALVPQLWSMREASRMVFVEDFALTILAAYGIEALVMKAHEAEGARAGWIGLDRVLLAIVIACAAALFVPGIYGKPDLYPWTMLSIILIFASYGLFRYLEHGNRGGGVRLMMVALILFDLNACDWTAVNRIAAAKSGGDYMDRIRGARGAAQFLKAQKGTFRVQIAADPAPNIGDLFGVPIVNLVGGVTLPFDFARMMPYPDLLNVRYILAPATEQKPGAIYQDSSWKVYENPSGFPRAWMVHETVVEPSAERAAARLAMPGFDARQTALTEVPVALEPLAANAQETAQVSAIAPNQMELEVNAQSRGLLVLSENYYPGWRATIDGQSAPIYRVDSGLRGLIVPRGRSRVELRYAPASVYWGGLLSFLGFAGALAAVWIRRQS